MATILIEVFVILILIFANGLFAMIEVALLSARKSRLQRLAAHGDRRAAAALELADHPDRFLSTVQIGITMVGILAGAIGGATIAEQIDDWLEHVPGMEPYSEVIAFGSVILAITYLTLVVGELVPKRIALGAPERIAAGTARFMRSLSRMATPAVWLLTRSTRFVLRLLRVRDRDEADVTAEDLRAMLRQGTASGTISLAARTVVERVFRLGERPVVAIMTPRAEVEWVDLSLPVEEIRARVLASKHTRLPAAQQHLDNLAGIVVAKDLWSSSALDSEQLRRRLLEPLFVPETLPAFRLLELFRQSGNPIAIVLDEYGAVEGLATPANILEALIGEIPMEGEVQDERSVRRADGSWLLDASLGLDEVKSTLGVALLEGEKAEGYQTLAGYVIEQMRQVPRTGQLFDKGGFRFEIVDMDGKRVDKILVSRTTLAAGPC